MSLVRLIVTEAVLMVLILVVQRYAPEPPRWIFVVILTVIAVVLALIYLVNLGGFL